jgi:hypothetical protein
MFKNQHGIGFRFYLRRFCLNRCFQVVINAQSQTIGLGLKNFKCRINFEYFFLEKYLHDFRYKNMPRLSMALAFDFT